jgi:hypothetical protein
METNPPAGFSLPFTMGDWALIIDALRSRILQLKTVPETDANDDDVADAYADIEGLEGILRQISAEFEKRYGGLPG